MYVAYFRKNHEILKKAEGGGRVNTRGITLRELMELSVLGKAKVISGEQGLDRVVRFVDIMEVPDLKGWISEGVMLLTTAYSIRHDPSLLTEVIYTLDNLGAAALAIKPARFLKEIPKVPSRPAMPAVCRLWRSRPRFRTRISPSR